MNLRGGTTSLERGIRDTRDAIAKAEQEQAQHIELADQASNARRAVADDPTAFADLDRKAATHRSEAERLSLVLERRSEDLAELEERLALARYEERRSALESSLTRQADASGKFARAIATADRAAASLLAARDEVDEARKAAHAACPTDIDEEDAGPDEPDWPAAARIVEMLEGGPRQPLARLAKASTERERNARKTRANEVFRAVDDAMRRGDLDRCKRLRSDQLSPAVECAERFLSDERERRERANSEADHLLYEGKQTRQIFETLERRLDRIRELAAEAEAADAAAVA